jgi:type II secretory pathway pseudopilin PulG
MRLPFLVSSLELRASGCAFRAGKPALETRNPKSEIRNESAFTMVEIALSLAIIGFALVAILGVLPFGLNVQRENREETIINQDATIWMNAIRNGAQGYDDLTNYAIAITITNTADGTTLSNTPTSGLLPLISGSRIIGMLSTNLFIGSTTYMFATVRSISGSAVEKFPQNHPLILGDAFSYKMIVQVFPYVPDPNFSGRVTRELWNNSHDVRLTFRWPLYPNGSVGNNRQTFRALVGGQMTQTNVLGWNLCFIQPPNYTNAP